MNRKQMSVLSFLSLLFLVPGLAGLAFSAVTSMRYEKSLPRLPEPAQLRMTPREIDGVVVYQTADEDRRLRQTENASGGLFLIGLTLGLVYMPGSVTSPH